MFDLIIEKIMSNIAQYTDLFSLTKVNENCTTQNNTLTIAGLDGKYVLSGAEEGNASKGCFNTIHEFVNGVAETNCFFGSDATIVPCVRHEVNVGEAITRRFALEKMNDTKTPNVVILYWENTTNTQAGYTQSISQDSRTQLKVDFGVMFRVKASEMQTLGGCDALDKIFIQSVIETKEQNDNATIVKFDGIVDRFFAGEYIVVDLAFSYLDDIDLASIISSRAKYFNATLEDVKTQN